MKIAILLLTLMIFGCEGKPKPSDIILQKNQALYHLAFRKVDEKLKTDWIGPHLTSLKGDNVRTISSQGIAGGNYEVFWIVDLQEPKTIEDLKSENRQVFDSLRKKTDFSLTIRIGN